MRKDLTHFPQSSLLKKLLSEKFPFNITKDWLVSCHVCNEPLS